MELTSTLTVFVQILRDIVDIEFDEFGTGCDAH